jgi:NDP-sugar pyrophosphorylase family protein
LVISYKQAGVLNVIDSISTNDVVSSQPTKFSLPLGLLNDFPSRDPFIHSIDSKNLFHSIYIYNESIFNALRMSHHHLDDKLEEELIELKSTYAQLHPRSEVFLLFFRLILFFIFDYERHKWFELRTEEQKKKRSELMLRNKEEQNENEEEKGKVVEIGF